MKDGVALSDDAHITGSAGEVLTLSPASASDAGSYTVVVSGTCENVISEPAILTVNLPTIITVQPVSQIICEGQPVMFSIAATGSNLTWQWFKDGLPVADEAGRVTGSSTSNLSISPCDLNDNGVYTCRVSGSGGQMNSATAFLTVQEDVQVISQPVSKAVCPGSNTSFNVAATGTNLQYQWQFNDADIPGATNATLALLGVSSANAGNYRCIVTGSCGPVSSNLVTLTVYENISIRRSAG